MGPEYFASLLLYYPRPFLSRPWSWALFSINRLHFCEGCHRYSAKDMYFANNFQRTHSLSFVIMVARKSLFKIVLLLNMSKINFSVSNSRSLSQHRLSCAEMAFLLASCSSFFCQQWCFRGFPVLTVLGIESEGVKLSHSPNWTKVSVLWDGPFIHNTLALRDEGENKHKA